MLFSPVTTSAWKGRMTTYFVSGECEQLIIIDCILPLFTHWLSTTQWTKADTEKPFVSKLVCFEPDTRVLLARIVEKNQGAVRSFQFPFLLLVAMLVNGNQCPGTVLSISHAEASAPHTQDATNIILHSIP